MTVPSHKKLAFIFYIDLPSEGRQFVLFADSPTGIITGDVLETDTNATTLAGARILLSELHSSLSGAMLSGNDRINSVATEELELKATLASDWITLWKHAPYYQLQEFLSVTDIYNTDDLSFFTFCIKLSSTGRENLNTFRQIRLVSSEEISAALNTIGALDTDFKTAGDLITRINEFNAEPLSKQNTFIQFVNKPHGLDAFVPGRSFVPVHAIYKGVFKRKFEHWFAFNVAKDEYPSEELLAVTKTLIVPGSGAGAWENIPWVVKLSQFLKRVHATYTDMKFIGICFGFQIIATTFGGKVKQMEGRKKDPHFHVIGNEELHVSPKLAQQPFVKDIFPEGTETIYINKGHGDFVEILPGDVFENMGTSMTAVNELAMSKDGRMFCLQGHPEYAFEYSRRLMATFSTCHSNEHDWNWHMKSEQFQKLFSKANDHAKLLRMINNFIRQ